MFYSAGTDTFLEDLTRNANPVFYFDEGPRATTKLVSKAYPRAPERRTNAGSFSLVALGVYAQAKTRTQRCSDYPTDIIYSCLL
jgi:hypothetical protein